MGDVIWVRYEEFEFGIGKMGTYLWTGNHLVRVGGGGLRCSEGWKSNHVFTFAWHYAGLRQLTWVVHVKKPLKLR